MSGDDSGQMIASLARMAESFERRAQRYEDLNGRMSAITVTEYAPDRSVSVTVDSNGFPTDIHLSAATRGVDPATVSARIMTCLRDAQARLRHQVTELVQNTVGEDTAGATIVSRYSELFPDRATEEPRVAPPEPPLPTNQPPPYSPPPQADSPQPPRPNSRKPDRDQIVVPTEPDEDDEYYRRKSWLV